MNPRGLPDPTSYLHPSGHSHHLARAPRLYPQPIPMRSDEQFVAELAERMRRKKHNGSLGRCDEWGCDSAATTRITHNGVHWFCCAGCGPAEGSP